MDSKKSSEKLRVRDKATTTAILFQRRGSSGGLDRDQLFST